MRAVLIATLACAVMAGTHLVIDRFRLAGYWCRFWGVGCEGSPARRLRLLADRCERRGQEVCGDEHWAWPHAHLPPREAPEPAPPYLAVWLLIIVDNTLHLTINAAALAFLD